MEVSQHGRNLYSKDNVIPHTADDEWNCIMSGAKQKIAVSSWPRWTFIAPAIPNATYYWTVSCYEVGFLDKDKNVLTYKSGWGNNTNIKAPANAVYVYHTWIKNESMSQEQLDAAFKTYDLYCDIPVTVFEEQSSKKTDYEFGVLGKNKFDYTNADIVNRKRLDDNGNEVSDTTGSYCKLKIPVIPNKEYTLSGYTASSSKRIYYYNIDGDFISRSDIYSGSSFTFTTLNDCYYIQIQLNEETASGWDTMQLELGSTATAYEPYDPKHTVYGGWVDLISGEVWSTYKTIKATWGDYTLYNSTSYNDNYEHRKYICDKSVDRSGGGSGFSDVAKKIWTDAFISSHFYIGNSDIHMFLPTGTSSDLEVNVYAKLSEPILAGTLAPTQLQTFLGQNNVWSNADYVEVEYDLHETQNILARK